MNESRRKLLHHCATGVGFVFLILWFYLGRKTGILDLITEQAPSGYEGAGLMLGIMLMMTPGFFLWTLWTRWTEKRLQIKGRYYEDGVFKDPVKRKKK